MHRETRQMLVNTILNFQQALAENADLYLSIMRHCHGKLNPI